MGWDLTVQKDGHYLDPQKDAALLAEFAAASDALIAAGHTVDIFLREGHLHLSGCRRQWERIFGWKPNEMDWLDAERVGQLYLTGNWIEPPLEDDLSYFLNLETLFELCLRHQLGLEISP